MMAIFSVHGRGGISGRSAVSGCGLVQVAIGPGRAEVELQDSYLKHARGPDDRREIGAGRVAGEGW